ncbi:hypothetical protein ACFFX1_44340 [Dactylosporangium sucinum]|uniref:hypothetical protein n=1 Tax=Dactylosporangium sucinum TaxID=1424081 RepID=UPI00167CEC57|nr:hypothetical protein [Dactylosporangium sucinum]
MDLVVAHVNGGRGNEEHVVARGLDQRPRRDEHQQETIARCPALVGHPDQTEHGQQAPDGIAEEHPEDEPDLVVHSLLGLLANATRMNLTAGRVHPGMIQAASGAHTVHRGRYIIDGRDAICAAAEH